ncbi:hypothetical protein [Paenibacillus sp. Leaf72]|uniref:hypothetical protein n=1 Tax=Paenibacillus sp. Leaf72 TaxID=1736234 RepID=UPI0006F92D08|nr:hypothetical protein [Paenibacillus sp. Leaf72]KQN96837.1 hypothetical protein ASF12_22460 [Paenibacillus sp. Leaf72]
MNIDTQLMMEFDSNFDQYGPWIVTQRADKAGAALADRHYSRKTVGSPHFTRPGKRNLVLRTAEGDAVWVSYYGEWRKDGLDAWENSLFRNESSYMSSDLVKWAIFATYCEWGSQLPKDGYITYVKSSALRSDNPGCNYLNAGFARVGYNKSGKLLLLQLSVDKKFLPLEEIYAVKYLEACQNSIDLALSDGDYMEAIWFYKEAKKKQEYLLALKSAKHRMKKNKWNCFESTIDSYDLLLQMTGDDWIPCEMMDLLSLED